MLGHLAFHAVIGLAVGKFGLWGPDQPFDPNNPVNPVAIKVSSAILAMLSGFATTQMFGADQLILSTIGAGAGSMLFNDLAQSFGLFSKKK